MVRGDIHQSGNQWEYRYPQHRTYYTARRGEVPSSSDSYGQQRRISGQRGEWSSSHHMYKPREGQTWTTDFEMHPRRSKWDWITESPTQTSSSSPSSGAWPYQYASRITDQFSLSTSNSEIPPPLDMVQHWRSKELYKRLGNSMFFLTFIFLFALLTSTVRHQSKLKDTDCDAHLSNSNVRIAYLVYRLLLGYCIIGIILWLVVIQKCHGCPFCCVKRESRCMQTAIVWLAAGLLLTGVMTFAVWNAIDDSCVSLYSKIDKGFIWTSFRLISCFSVFALGVMTVSMLLNAFFCTCCRSSTTNTLIGNTSFKVPEATSPSIFSKEDFVAKYSPEPARCDKCGEEVNEVRCKDCWVIHSFINASSHSTSID